MTLRRKVVNLVGLRVLYDANKICRIGHIPVMNEESCVNFARIRVNTVNALRVIHGCAPFDSMDDVPFIQKQPYKIGSVLSGSACYQCCFCQDS